MRCRTRSASAINDRPQNGHSSTLNQCRKMQNVTFSAALGSPLLTSGEPRRRSFFGSIREFMRALQHRSAGTRPNVRKRREPLKIILVAASRGHHHLPNVALASRRSTSLRGRYFVCPIRRAPAPHPCSESGRRYTMRVSDPSAFMGVNCSPRLMNSTMISYGFRQTGCTLSGRLRDCLAEVGQL